MATTKENETHKSNVALTSVLAAVGLTGMKVVVGVLTGSLGILAEAAHSGLDLIAALITYLAVRISGKPADSDHRYGHGKVENLSALFETLLLLVTCVWIIYEALKRLLFRHIEVEVSVWSFVVMITSILVDINRSRMLYGAAKKYNSQALEADALHFSTDIWSSSVVILGLICVKLSEWFPAVSFLKLADSIAAMGVAVIVIYVSIELGIRTVQGLLDTAPKGMPEDIKHAVEQVKGVNDCHQIRIRRSGPYLFIDAHVLVEPHQTLEEAHLLIDKIETVILKIAPGADVTIHPEPIPHVD